MLGAVPAVRPRWGDSGRPFPQWTGSDTEAAIPMSQQPGKPKPPGNPPKTPDHDVPPPVEEPPQPVPIPPERDDPPPMQSGRHGYASLSDFEVNNRQVGTRARGAERA